MFGGVLEKLLLSKLSLYLTGLEKNNLSESAGKGDIIITDADIRPEALRVMQLPVQLVLGRIQKFMIRVPWAKLTSAPVEVELSGLYVLLTENPKSEWKFDEEFAISRLKEGLERFETQWKQQQDQKQLTPEEELKGKSFTDRLSAKIIDNLIIRVKDIHVRFEGQVGNKELALGLVLQGVTCMTTNAQWSQEYVDTQVEGRAGEDIYKLSILSGLGVYLNHTNSIPLRSIPDPSSLLSSMHDLIYSQAPDSFLISPSKS